MENTAYYIGNAGRNDLDKFAEEIFKVAKEFIEQDKENAYKVIEYKLRFSPTEKPYVHCWVRVLDKRAFYNGKNRVHRHLYCRNTVGLHNNFIKFLLDVKEI